MLSLFRRGAAAHVAGWASATVEIIRAASGLKRCVLPRGAAEEMLIAACAVWNRAGVHLPIRRLETLTRRGHGVCARHHTGIAERARVDSRLLHRDAAMAEFIARAWN